jgi:hypothetical protein
MSFFIYYTLLLSILWAIHDTPLASAFGSQDSSLRPRQVEDPAAFAAGVYILITAESMGGDFIGDIVSAGGAAFGAFKGLPSVCIPASLIE